MGDLSFLFLTHLGAGATGLLAGWLVRRVFFEPKSDAELMGELRRQRDAAQTAHAGCKGRIEQLSVEAAAVPTLRAELAELAARTGAEAELAATRAELADLRQKLQDIDTILNDVSAAESAERARIEALEHELRLARGNVEARDGEIEHLHERLRTLREGWDAREAQWRREQRALAPQPPPVIDDLTLIHGVGPQLEARLNEHGIYTYADLAERTEPIVDVDSGAPLIHESWRTQARKLHHALYGTA